MQCLKKTAGCNLLGFHQILSFLCIRILLCHLHTASQSLVEILCEEDSWLPLGLGIYAVSYKSLAVSNYSGESVQLENLRVMSSGGCIQAICQFLISRLSVGVLISVVGQLDGSCESHCGPFHHSVDVDSIVGSIPLEMRSGGLD